MFPPCISLQTYIQKVVTTEMPLLEQRLADSNRQLSSLMDFVTLSPEDLELNALTVHWFQRMPSIFEEHQHIIDEKTEHFQSALEVCESALNPHCVKLRNYPGLMWQVYWSAFGIVPAAPGAFHRGTSKLRDADEGVPWFWWAVGSQQVSGESTGPECQAGFSQREGTVGACMSASLNLCRMMQVEVRRFMVFSQCNFIPRRYIKSCSASE